MIHMLEANSFPAFFVLAVIGATLCMWTMQLSGNQMIARGEKPCLRWTRRIGLALTATGLLWAVRYGYMQEWQPWPPFLLIVAGLDISLAITVLSGYRRQTTNGSQTEQQQLAA